MLLAPAANQEAGMHTFNAAQGGAGIHRLARCPVLPRLAALPRALKAKAASERYHLGATVEGIEVAAGPGGGVEVTLQGGRQFSGDLLVGADGCAALLLPTPRLGSPAVLGSLRAAAQWWVEERGGGIGPRSIARGWRLLGGGWRQLVEEVPQGRPAAPGRGSCRVGEGGAACACADRPGCSAALGLPALPRRVPRRGLCTPAGAAAWCGRASGRARRAPTRGTCAGGGLCMRRTAPGR